MSAETGGLDGKAEAGIGAAAAGIHQLHTADPGGPDAAVAESAGLPCQLPASAAVWRQPCLPNWAE